MGFPNDWTVLPKNSFDLQVTRIEGLLTIELHAVVRPSWRVLRVHAQTIYYQENLAFCFQLCTVAHFVGFLLLSWFSSSLGFFLSR